MIPLGLRTAVRQLTVVPLPWDAREEFAQSRSVVWFPLIGLAIGCVIFAILHIPLSPHARAAVALSIWIAISGGLHEDAVMDSMDAAIPPVDPARRRAILKDPHVGAHGVTVAGLLLIARFAALAEGPALAALVGPIAGRWAMALTLASGRPAACHGLGARFAEGASQWWPSAIAIALLTMIGALTSWAPALSAIIGTLFGVAAGHAIAARLGGFNGDVHGAGGVVAETCTLYACLVST